MTRRPVPILALGAVLLLANACASTWEPARGEDPDIPGKARAGLRAAGLDPEPSVEFNGFYALPADVDGGSGEVSGAASSLRVTGGVPIGFLGFLALAGTYEYRTYSIEDLDLGDFGGNDNPVGDFQTAGIQASWIALLGDDPTEDWGLIARAGVRTSVESGADALDGVSALALVIAGKQLAPGLRAGVGLGFSTRLDDDPLVIPAVGFDWEISETFRLRVLGPGLEFTARLDDERTLGLVARYDFRTFRLDDSGPGANGILEDDRIPVMLRFTQSLGEISELRLYAGVDVYRRLELLDDDGDLVDRVRTGTAGMLGVSLQIGL